MSNLVGGIPSAIYLLAPIYHQTFPRKGPEGCLKPRTLQTNFNPIPPLRTSVPSWWLNLELTVHSHSAIALFSAEHCTPLLLVRSPFSQLLSICSGPCLLFWSPALSPDHSSTLLHLQQLVHCPVSASFALLGSSSTPVPQPVCLMGVSQLK